MKAANTNFLPDFSFIEPLLDAASYSQRKNILKEQAYLCCNKVGRRRATKLKSEVELRIATPVPMYNIEPAQNPNEIFA